MPLLGFRIQYKNNNKYEENWDLNNPRTYFDNKTPDLWEEEWKDWFSLHPNDLLNGAKCFFYTLDTNSGEMYLDETRKILKLKPQPRILNDDSRQTP